MAGLTFDNKVTIVTATPVTAATINGAITTLNNNGYWISFIQFVDANTVAILAVLTNTADYGHMATQKVNQVAATQVAVDADKTTEAALGYRPTGLSLTPGGAMLIVYTLDPYAQNPA